MATSDPMALNTPKRLKTAVPPCANYLSTPPPSSVSVGSPPPAVGTATQSQAWNNWLSDTASPTSSCSSPDGAQNRSYGGHNSSGTPHNWSSSGGSAEKSENKRGRPRSEALTTLMVEGSISPSAIKCHYCHRVFPREKSLQAHLRTHTGERPYHCDYPGCTRAFTQSGQLKTHQRLHTGERPFICSVPHCQMRFTHANRHCPDHPYDTLRRCDDFVIQTVPEQNDEVLRWLEKYRAEREDRTPTRKTPKRSSASNGVSPGAGAHAGGSMNPQNENGSCRTEAMQKVNNENCLPDRVLVMGAPGGVGAGADSGCGVGPGGNVLPSSPLTPNNPYKSSNRKGLMDMNACMGPGNPVMVKAKNSLPKLIQWQEPTSQEEDESGDECCAPSTQSTFNPKKKWLRDAWQDDLAKPLEPNLISQKVFASTTSTMALKQQLHQETTGSSNSPRKRAFSGATGHGKPLPRMDGISVTMPVPAIPSIPVGSLDPNQTRPTVLMVASKDCARPLSDQPAAALVPNGTGPKCADSAPKPEENNRKLQGALALMQLAAKNALPGGPFDLPDVSADLVGNESNLYGEEVVISPPNFATPVMDFARAEGTNGGLVLPADHIPEMNGQRTYS